MRSVPIVIVAAAAVAAAHAAEAPVTRGAEIVVTATRIPEPLASAIAHTTVITAEEIAASGAADLPTLLRSEAGVEVAQSGGLGSQASVFLRGTNSNHTLVLIDGVRVGSATTGAAALDQILLDQVERIEIVRGNASSVHGSDAIGGVVQIFTRKGRGAPALSAQAGIGGERSGLVAANFGGEAGATRFHLGVARRETAGFSAIRREFIPVPFVTSPADLDRDGYRNSTFSASLAHAPAQGHELGATAFHSAGKLDTDGAFSNSGKQDLSAYSLYSRNALTDRWQSRMTLSRGTDDLEAFLDGTPVGRFRTDNTQFTWQNDLRWSERAALVLALERLQQKVGSDTAYTRARRHANSAFAGYVARLGGHSVQLNLRADDYSDFGSHGTYYAGYGYAPAPGWRLTASVATAFRAPSFNDLFHPGFFGRFAGSPNLKPERARTQELSVQYQGPGQLAKAVYFRTRISDLVAFASVFPFNAINVGRAENEGFELSYSGTLAGLEIKLAATLQDPVNAATGARLLRRAARFGSLSAGRAWGAWHAAVELRASGPREDIHIATFGPVRVAGYGVVNLTARYALDKNASLDLRIDNAFDRDYMLVHGYNTQGRKASVSLRHVF